MHKIFFAFIIFPVMVFSQNIPTRFETSDGKQTPTYEEIISWWKKIDAASPYVTMKEMGPTDAGYPLHLVLVSWDKDFDMASIRKKNKTIIFINNGIHPGEPDGIDASMLLVKEMINPAHHLPNNVVLAIIPVYNIGGVLNRSANFRVDQNGPEEFGFRGNSQNLDLNRDFIKCDSKEALTFTKIFHYLDPAIFIDNHVSNGADYQHIITLLTSQHNKLGGAMGKFLNEQFEPALYAAMKTKGHDLVPYVNHFGETPEKGWSQYWDSPRFSSGYAALWSTFSFMPETHMLKSYRDRVMAVKALMESFIDFASAHGPVINKLREQTKQQQQTQDTFPIAWKRDRSKFTEITYKGFESGRKTSEVSGLPRLFYDRNKPFEKMVPFYNVFTDTLSVQKPKAYIIPQGWSKVIDRLIANGVQLHRLTKDTSIEVQVYRIESYQSDQRQFEGHHLNSKVQVSKMIKKMSFRKGDYYIPMNQRANRFLVEILEPQGEDSYFAWNFFDPVLGQKEGYSDYHFEDVAAAYLKSHPEVRTNLEQLRATDSNFARNADAQLNFVYLNSPYYEPSHKQYPVFRVQ